MYYDLRILIFLSLIIVTSSELNLHYTNQVSDFDNILSHDCLRVTVYFGESLDEYQIVSYCMSELSSKFFIKNDKNRFNSKFTFNELSKQNITSQQLYIWSTPIDIIERYQLYLNQLSTSNNSSLGKQVFYNCTKPRFGPMCQYELIYYPHNLSLFEIIRDFQEIYRFKSTAFTCYIHLQCNRGPFPACLDWSEICDGKIDCLDNGLDEEYCWQLEMNQCQDDEYRCANGQCIPKSFDRDHYIITDCIDGSDKSIPYLRVTGRCHGYEEPLHGCDDLTCKHTHFTSSCVKGRENLLIKSMYLNRDIAVSDDCWSALKCLIYSTDSSDKKCKNTVENTCPAMLYFPSVPGLLDDIYFAHRIDDLPDFTIFPPISFYICYTKSHYNDYFVNVSKIFIDHTTCIHSNQFYPQEDPLAIGWKYEYDNNIYKVLKNLKRYHLNMKYTSTICNQSNMYQCINSSKCISMHRLKDSTYDCPQTDDENIGVINNENLMEQLKKYRFKCPSSNQYIHLTLRDNLACDCKDECEDEGLTSNDITDKIIFQNICDEFIDMKSIMIEGRNETDETECEQWPCNNIYTHCNDVWNCPKGADEAGCISFLTLNCSSKHHSCISPNTSQFICLPIEKANDGHVDCLGGTDEPTLCQTNTATQYINEFYCLNQNSKLCLTRDYLCNGIKDCTHGDDEQFCVSNRSFHWSTEQYQRSNVENFIYEYMSFKIRQQKYLAFDVMNKKPKLPLMPSGRIIQLSVQRQPRCHRGLDLRVWLNNQNNLIANTCLCPPSYYGDQCQYQNQRISLGIKFRALSDSWQTLFAIVISLIDDSPARIIHSYEQLSFLSMRDCKIKFNIYLLYSTRPKDLSKNYFIHIDIYEKFSLSYRGSLLFPVDFSFLPVYRLALIIDIPGSDDKTTRSCSNSPCIHGKCIKYSNSILDNRAFCQCYQGWSGQYCTIQYSCMCSPDSICIGISAHNRSICVCPTNKFGPQCLLTSTVCQLGNNSICENGGRCISNDDYNVPNRKFVCICPIGFSGDRCELADNKLNLSFAKDITLSQSIFIHFIEIINMHNPPVRATTFKTIPLRHDSVTIYWSRPFHLVVVELPNKIYYLTAVQNTYTKSTSIVKMIESSDRCQHINELLNKTFVQLHLIRRIKYYHLPCQIYSSNLQCFYDDIHLCLCYEFNGKRLTNCFNFDHNMTFNCFGQSECENGAQCLQDHPECPTRSMCICPPCFYGQRCQFSTSSFGISLDAILGYHILPHLNFTNQPLIIQISLALTIIFMLTGLVNGVLSLITFNNKTVCRVGCGFYLLGSSITTLLITIMFGLKFLILLLTQMTIISNQLFLLIQCHSIDFILRVCLNMDQWLNACVAFERAMAAMKRTRFDKKKSKQAAKFVIIILLIVVIGTSIQDPIYRNLITEEHNDGDNFKRIWCIISYPSNLQVYNYVIHSFHFCGAFIINVVSVIILIKEKSNQEGTVHPQLTYRKRLQRQFRQHRHLLTAPIVLVILALPRLIISFVSKCMKSANDSWLFLIGYFISFIPPMLTFVVFIIPSKLYKTELQNSTRQFRTTIRRRFQRI